MANSTLELMMTTLNEIEDHDGYDGPAFDVASIVLVVLLGISCCVCICMSCFDNSHWSRCTFWMNILMFGLGLNLLIRYINDQCYYDPNVSCGGRTLRGGGSAALSHGKSCSHSCILLNIFGIILMCISGLLLICSVFAMWKMRDSTKTSNNERTKVGCECCHCYL